MSSYLSPSVQKSLLTGLVYYIIETGLAQNKNTNAVLTTAGCLAFSSFAFHYIEGNIPHLIIPSGNLDIDILFGYHFRLNYDGMVIEHKIMELALLEYIALRSMMKKMDVTNSPKDLLYQAGSVLLTDIISTWINKSNLTQTDVLTDYLNK